MLNFQDLIDKGPYNSWKVLDVAYHKVAGSSCLTNERKTIFSFFFFFFIRSPGFFPQIFKNCVGLVFRELSLSGLLICFRFEQYVDYALDVPMYFVYRNKKYIDCTGMSFRVIILTTLLLSMLC